MANTRAGSVIRVDTSANFPDVRDIESIKYVGNTSATKGEAIISKGVAAADGSGSKVWDNGNATTGDVLDENVNIRCNTGFYVNVGAHGAALYLYLKP